MKRLSLYLFLAMLIVTPVVLQSCDDDDVYSLNNFQVRMATVRVISGNNYYLEIDNGRTLFPAASQVYWYKPVEGQRVVADYTLLYDNYYDYDYGVRVNFIRNVLTKSVEELTEDNAAEYGNDPVKIYDMWIGANYLNVQFRFNLPVNKAHRVSLVRNTTAEDMDDGYIHLEYRYNDYDDATNYERWGMVSFYLGDYSPETAAATYKGIKVKINSAVNGEKDLTYEFPEKESASNNRTVEHSDEVEEGKTN